MLFTTLGRSVLGITMAEVLSPVRTSNLKEFLVWFAESLPVTGQTLTLIDSNYAASENVLYKRNLQASINLNKFIILEISQKLKYNEQRESCYHTIQANRNVPDSSTRGVHTQRSKRYVLWETKLPFIVHVSVSKSQDKWDKISVIRSILTLVFRLCL